MNKIVWICKYYLNHEDAKAQSFTKTLCFFVLSVSLWFNSSAQLKPFVLKQDQFKHYVNYLNTME